MSHFQPKHLLSKIMFNIIGELLRKQENVLLEYALDANSTSCATWASRAASCACARRRLYYQRYTRSNPRRATFGSWNIILKILAKLLKVQRDVHSKCVPADITVLRGACFREKIPFYGSFSCKPKV